MDFNSKDFQTRLIHDIINGSSTVNDLKLYDKFIPSVREIDIHDTYGSLDGINVEFSLNYQFNGQVIPLHLFFDGTLYFDVSNKPETSDGYNIPKEGGLSAGQFDYSGIDINILTEEGEELKTDWLAANDKIANQLCGKLLNNIIEIQF